MKTFLAALLCSMSLLAASFAGESKIVSIGSDTMSQLLKNTAEAFKSSHSGVSIEITDPGSSAGIGAMINGQSDICPASRPMKKEEYETFEKKFGAGSKPMEVRVALDGIVIYVNKDNPINQLSMSQIARVFAQNPGEDVTEKGGKVHKAIGAKITKWGELDSTLPAEWRDAKINLYSRNAASGTYGYFKEHALDNHDYDKSCQEMPGTSAVVNGCAKDKFAIGYGGIGYKTQDVKLVPVAPKDGEPAIAPTLDSVAQHRYPISRALQIYVPKKPDGAVREYLAFVLSKEGQELIGSEKVGFVPLPDAMLENERAKLK